MIKQMDTIELEKKLLSGIQIVKQDIRSKFESLYDENFDDSYSPVEDQVNDEFNKYVELVNLFGERVFIYNEMEEIIKLNPSFKGVAEYLLCLLSMQNNGLKEKERKKMSNYFEEVSAEAIKQYLGKNAESKIVDTEDINIKLFFTDTLKEKHHPDIENNFKKTPRCDIIAWKPIDNRYGKIILLIQCKSGKKWRDENPVNLNLMKTEVGNFSAEPIKTFIITDLLDDEEISDCSKEKGLIFDRARIIALLSNVENDRIISIRNNIHKLNLIDKIVWE